ncbi:UNVERIFIED_CONTAM: hypothetical protein FKN15_040872 [Acipenser sinensis]
MDRNALAELLQALESRRDAEERRREERYTALIERILADIEKHSPNGQEEEDWEKALSVERFGDFISETSSRHTEKTGRSYNERDFEYHRHTSHHTHHPLSTHLPPTMRFRKRVFRIDRRKKKKRKKKKTSVPPSDVTPTIHEVDEEEEESDAEGRRQGAMPTPPLDDKPKILADIEKHSPNGQEEEDWEKTLSVERFGDFISETSSWNAEKTGRSYSERDFETSSRHTEKTGRSYNERDFEYHRHTSHHTHHPLSTHLPPTTRFRKKVFHVDRRKKKKRKKKKTSIPPSNITPTIQEVNEEEEESDAEGRSQGAMPTPPLDDKPKFSIGVEEDHTQPLPFQNFHVENECTPSPESPPSTSAPVMKLDPLGWGETLSRFSQLPQDTLDLPSRGWFKRKPLHRLTGGQRASYDLRERICIGSMTAMETAIYQKVPTDEAEAQMLASADLDGMKRFAIPMKVNGRDISLVK